MTALAVAASGTSGGRRVAAIPSWAPVAVAVVAASATAAAVVDAAGPVRVVAVLVMVSFAPGLPVVALLALPSRAITIMLGVSASWASWLLLSLGQVAGGWWAPVPCAVLVTAVSVVAAYVAVRSGRVNGARAARVRVPVRRWDRWRVAAVAALVGAAVLGWWETRVIDLDAAGPYGLIAVVGWRMFAALAAVAVAFAIAVGRRRLDQPVAGAAVALLVCLLYQLVGVADGSPVVSTGFVHVGFIDYIGAAHRLPPSLDARFSWSGFFDAAAVLVDLAGLPDAAPLLLWAPAVLAAFAALPVFTIATVVTGGRRLAWIAMAIYVCGNWFQQDYFAPQAVVFVMHCAIVATLLWMVRSAPIPRLEGTLGQRISTAIVRVPGLPPGIGRIQALLLELLLLFIAAAMVVSHQLTPVLTIATLTLMAAVGCLRRRCLPLAMGVLFLLWLSYGAPDYWTGHLHVILGDFGKVGSSLQSGLGDRFSGAAQYRRMQGVRIAWSGSLAVLAGFGWLLYRRKPSAPAVAAVLLAPFTLVAAQSYGGEIVLRCFYYALPVMAPLATLGLYRLYRRLGAAAFRRGAPVLVLTVAVWCASVLGVTTRGLNTAFERNPADLAAAARSLLDSVPDGTTLLPANGEGVLKQGRLTTVVWPQGGVCSVWTLDCVESFAADYILLSTSQQAALELQWGAPHGWLYAFGDQLVAQGRYRVVQRTPHALVLARTPGR